MKAPSSSNAIGLAAVALAVYLAMRDPYGLGDPWDTEQLPANERPTITRGLARQIAETVDQAVWSDSTFWSGWPVGSWTENEEVVIAAMTQPAIRTTGDVWYIMEAYGVRSAGIAPELTLVATLEKYLEPAERQAINDAWSTRRISVRLS